ncbi:uncharacterized protein LOC119362108 [Triticum dicoccoides]|uniref:uncharacterized protein LOC119362108 n=1 Tax=Triticum dicoccoides TaxID=85692 RepID=UPI00188F09BE|nr:uncharacterized protein LOC119362108 [Triticum dicoccoides]
MVKEKGNEKGKGAGKENAKAKAKEKSVNYLIRQDSALPPPVPRKKRKPKVQIRKAKDFPNAPTGELICRLKKHHPPPRRLPDRTGAGVRAAEAAASTIVVDDEEKGAHVDLNLVPRDENEEDDVENIKLPTVVEEIND